MGKEKSAGFYPTLLNKVKRLVYTKGVTPGLAISGVLREALRSYLAGDKSSADFISISHVTFLPV